MDSIEKEYATKDILHANKVKSVQEMTQKRVGKRENILSNGLIDNTILSKLSGLGIAMGYRLFAHHFLKLLRLTWPCALLSSIFFALCISLCVFFLEHLIVYVGQLTLFFAGIIPLNNVILMVLVAIFLIFLVLWAIYLLVCSQFFAPLKDYFFTGVFPSPKRRFYLDTPMLRRTLRAGMLCLPFFLIATALFFLVAHLLIKPLFVSSMAGNEVSTLSILGAVLPLTLLVAALILFLLPLLPHTIEYLFSPKTHFFSLLRSHYTLWLCHLGHIFTVVFVCKIVEAIATMIIILPAIVLLFAHIMSAIGVAMYGDPAGISTGVSVITGVMFLVSGLFYTYIYLSSLPSCCSMMLIIMRREAQKHAHLSSEDVI